MGCYPTGWTVRLELNEGGDKFHLRLEISGGSESSSSSNPPKNRGRDEDDGWLSNKFSTRQLRPQAGCGRLGAKETNIMKRVFSSPDTAQVGLYKNMLKKAGIRCAEINKQLAQTIPVAPFQAELWVEQESDYAEAMALLAAWADPPAAVGPSWVCSRCGESLGAQFTKCWKCGTPRQKDGPSEPRNH
jgi:hypothetical protein